MLAESADEKKFVDLHIHTKCSDGTSSVDEVLGAAAGKGLKVVAIADHDCIDAYPYASTRGAQLGIDVFTGVELSSESCGIDIHVLGYFVDIGHPAFNVKLQEIKEARYYRAQKIVQNLNRQGIDLRFDTVLKIAGDGAIGRPHIAAAMLKEELIYSFREAFDKYIGYDSPAYVEKLKMQPREVFDLILEANGIPVLAHPGITKVDERIPEFIRDGLMGIEVFHSEHSLMVQRYYRRLCRKHGLLMTGGSDFHSPDHNRAEIGYPRVPVSVADSLRKKHEELAAYG
jgi:predicted metal-dependent phosphoesterase TrpH